MKGPHPNPLPEGEGVGSIFADRNVEQLLGRPQRSVPLAESLRILEGARVLVTGAGGSVGSALVARLLAAGPERVIALDSHEASLFQLGRSISAGGSAPRPPGSKPLPLDLRLADVRNREKVRRTFAEARPGIVFHLAAYKHVPLGEQEPDEPVSVNVLGTEIVAAAAAEVEVSHLAYPSSDKAVDPPSIYGATKRLAEAVLAERALGGGQTAIHVARYVNVVGTSGSALETFAQQALQGAPLTLTDPRMTRYWMSMDEAVDLLWHALALPPGSHSMLDVGDPVPVRAMAERVYRLLRDDGSSPVFVEVGARPGERLAERLASRSEKLVRCGDDPVVRIEDGRPPGALARVPHLVEELRRLVAEGNLEQLRGRVMEFARELQ